MKGKLGVIIHCNALDDLSEKFRIKFGCQLRFFKDFAQFSETFEPCVIFILGKFLFSLYP